MELTLRTGQLLKSTHSLAIHREKGFQVYNKAQKFFITLFQNLFGCYKNISFKNQDIGNHLIAKLNRTEKQMLTALEGQPQKIATLTFNVLQRMYS
ncbi:MAG: hypothetical protein SP4CHLAM5_08090 [Chlamydiia bacterium]|nr:hypothetical protein [Chlamydiia bacterium]MCH9618673.1 hypothetical protein [Chlamydiia bacterium]MCH9624424.1 hypothetical protein [Chlamydiia bacterium]